MLSDISKKYICAQIRKCQGSGCCLNVGNTSYVMFDGNKFAEYAKKCATASCLWRGGILP